MTTMTARATRAVPAISQAVVLMAGELEGA